MVEAVFDIVEVDGLVLRGGVPNGVLFVEHLHCAEAAFGKFVHEVVIEFEFLAFEFEVHPTEVSTEIDEFVADNFVAGEAEFFVEIGFAGGFADEVFGFGGDLEFFVVGVFDLEGDVTFKFVAVCVHVADSWGFALAMDGHFYFDWQSTVFAVNAIVHVLDGFVACLGAAFVFKSEAEVGGEFGEGVFLFCCLGGVGDHSFVHFADEMDGDEEDDKNNCVCHEVILEVKSEKRSRMFW